MSPTSGQLKIYASAWIKISRATNLKNFPREEFDVGGRFLQNLITEVVEFSISTYTNMMRDCLQGNKWTFDNSFLYVGSVATTIGYGNVTPKTESGQSSSKNIK